MDQQQHLPDPLEAELTTAFGQTSTAVDVTVVDRAVGVADRRRRRRDLGLVLSSGAAVAALVIGGYAVPQVINANRAGGGSIAVAADGATPSDGITGWPEIPLTPAPPGEGEPDAMPVPTPTGGLIGQPLGSGLIPAGVFPTGAGLAMPDPLSPPMEAPAGAATLMGMQICDGVVVGQRLGDGATSVVRPVTSSTQSFVDARASVVADLVDVTISVLPTGQGALGLQQLATDTGFCLWYPSAPSIESNTPAGVAVSHTGPYPGTSIAGVATVVGDVLIGVTATMKSSEAAMAKAQQVSASVTEKVKAQMPQAQG